MLAYVISITVGSAGNSIEGIGLGLHTSSTAASLAGNLDQGKNAELSHILNQTVASWPGDLTIVHHVFINSLLFHIQRKSRTMAYINRFYTRVFLHGSK